MNTIILDFDGTLADTQKLITDTMLKTISELGLEKRTREQCAKMIGLPLKQTFTELIPMSDEMGDKCFDTYQRIFFEDNVEGAVPLFPHVEETIKALHQHGMNIAIASSRGRDTLTEFVKTFNLEQYIPYIVSATDVEKAKPHPEPVFKILDYFGTKAEDAIVVGDTKYDIEMGNNAHAHTCGVTYGNGTLKEMEACNAEHIIDDFALLQNII